MSFAGQPIIPRAARTLGRVISVGALAAGLGGCGKKPEASESSASASSSASGASTGEVRLAEEPARLWRADLESITQGRRIRLAWAQHASAGNGDAKGQSAELLLAGLDSQDGKGVRLLLKEKRNIHRPLLRSDGSGVVFTDLNAGPGIFLVSWDGGEARALGPGRAVAVWSDPQTKREWIYAHEAPAPMFPGAEQRNRIVRFPAEKADEREVVWAQTLVDPDGFQLSRDGLRASALLPAPNACVLNLEDSTTVEMGNGLWPAIAPDNSYVAWTLDPDRGSLRFHAPHEEETWQVSLSAAPGMGGATYPWHPRWSNHPALITFTGPYTKPPHDPAFKDNADGAAADIFIGRLGPAAQELMNAVRITQNDRGDVYPDLWAEGPAVETLGSYAQKPKPEPKANLLPWPANANRAAFAWDNLGRDVEARRSRVTAKGFARFGRNLEMLLSGGCFEADPETSAAVQAEAAGGQGFAFEALLSESRDGYGPLSARIISYRMEDGKDAFALYRVDTSLVLRILLGKEGEKAQTIPVALAKSRIDPSRPYHLVVSIYGKVLRAYIDGALISESTLESEGFAHWRPGVLQIGDMEPYGERWRGSAEAVAVYGRYLGEEEMRKNFDAAKVKMALRRPADRVNLHGKLVEATPIPPIPSWGPYPRILAGYTYEVQKVTAGLCDYPKIVVLHYAGMAGAVVPHFPREVGKTYKLSVEPASQHPELKSERVENSAAEMNAPVYVDADTPGEDYALKP